MSLYELVLGIDRAARDTGRRVIMHVFGSDPLAAAIQGEALVDTTLKDPVEYSHCMSATRIRSETAALAA